MNSAVAMNCSDAKHMIHLDVGDDLRSEEEQQLAVHMSQCEDCRAYHASMSKSMNVLWTLRDHPLSETRSTGGKSIWPSLAREIQQRNTSPRVARKFNLQVVALSVCSLSLAVVTMVQSLSSMREHEIPSGFMPAQSVSNQPYSPYFQSAPLSVPRQYNAPDRDLTNNVRTPLFPHEAPVSPPQSF